MSKKLNNSGNTLDKTLNNEHDISVDHLTLTQPLILPSFYTAPLTKNNIGYTINASPAANVSLPDENPHSITSVNITTGVWLIYANLAIDSTTDGNTCDNVLVAITDDDLTIQTKYYATYPTQGHSFGPSVYKTYNFTLQRIYSTNTAKTIYLNAKLKNPTNPSTFQAIPITLLTAVRIA